MLGRRRVSAASANCIKTTGVAPKVVTPDAKADHQIVPSASNGRRPKIRYASFV